MVRPLLPAELNLSSGNSDLTTWKVRAVHRRYDFILTGREAVSENRSDGNRPAQGQVFRARVKKDGSEPRVTARVPNSLVPGSRG